MLSVAQTLCSKNDFLENFSIGFFALKLITFVNLELSASNHQKSLILTKGSRISNFRMICLLFAEIQQIEFENIFLDFHQKSKKLKNQ